MGCPVAAWAHSGVMALTGQPDGPPLVPPGRGALLAASLGDRLAELTGGRVRVDGAALLAERAAFTGGARRGPVSVGGGCRLLPTADGLAAVSCTRADDPALLGALVGRVLDPEDPWPAVAHWLRGHCGAELSEGAGLLGLAAAPVGLKSIGTAPIGTASIGAGHTPPRSADGLLVIDFSALWAGPLCAHLLGLAGARVVKVETPSRPDGARLGEPDFYRLLHAGHRSVVLDPATSTGRRSMAALVEAADVVIEASRPRALARFGLSAEDAAASGTTWVSITAYGRDTDRVGFGDDVAASAGMVARDPEGRPAFCGDALADPLTGLTAAACALSTPAGGAGRLWDVSMAAVVAATLAPGGRPGTVPPARAYRDGGRWMIDTAEGPAPVAPPRRRPLPGGDAPVSGAHTAQVVADLGLPPIMEHR